MSTLYELTGAFNKVAEQLDDDPSTVVLDTLESLDLAIEDKADGYAKVIKNKQAESDALAAEIKRLQERKKTNENAVKRMMSSLENCMKEIGKTKFKTDLFSFNIQKNQKAVNIVDEKLIPEEFKVITVSYDKAAIKKAGDVPGVEITQSESLRIR